MKTLGMCHRLWWIAAGLVVVPPSAWSQGTSLEALNGKRVTFTIVMNVSGTNVRGPFTNAESRSTGHIQISGNAVSGDVTRVVTYQGRIVGSRSASLSGAIGQPQQGAVGNYVWVLDGGSLVLLRTFAVG